MSDPAGSGQPGQPSRFGASTPAGRGRLPAWRSVLVVVAHPDDESFGLGAVIAAFVGQRTAVHVLCFTHGELSTLGAGSADLATVRAADGLLVFDPSGVTGHSDHQAATRAAVRVASRLSRAVLACVLPREMAEQLERGSGARQHGVEDREIDIVVEVDPARQRDAVHAHLSKAVPSSILWRPLELLGARESLRWLLPPPTPGRAGLPPSTARHQPAQALPTRTTDAPPRSGVFA